MIVCWPIRRAARAAIKHTRRARRVRRAAVAIVCISIGGFGSAALLPPVLFSPPFDHRGGAPTAQVGSNTQRPWGDFSAPATDIPIPEPGSALLLATAVAALWGLRR